MSRVDDFIVSHWDSMTANERSKYIQSKTIRDTVRWVGVIVVSALVCFMALWPSCTSNDNQLKVEQAKSAPYQKRIALERCLDRCNRGYWSQSKDSSKTGNCAQMCADAIDKVVQKNFTPQK